MQINNCIEGNLYFKYYVRKKKEIKSTTKLPTLETRNKEQTKLNPHRRKGIITRGEIDDTENKKPQGKALNQKVLD